MYSWIGNLDNLLAEILALQHPDEGVRRVLDSNHHIFLVLDLALFQPRHDVFLELSSVLRNVVRKDESLDPEPLPQDILEIVHALGFLAVVLRDHATDGDAREIFGVLQHDVKRLPAHVLKVHVDSARTHLRQRLGRVARLVVERRVVPAFLEHEPYFGIVSGRSHDSHPLQLSDLPNELSHRTGC
ncbi:hypothetical protein BC938DRAFT_479629 [Jimgerdemannia flammicorona]|uniref:Uncharacterized protein n=1 Tax=Jimgerdemannia flammicorona TaxID=994334 RepID=A0A433QXQ0_9FUNG|nr:hypothetical protein BC938DRAFT_479629 [Jimgerdemannia flammicorona]